MIATGKIVDIDADWGDRRLCVSRNHCCGSLCWLKFDPRHRKRIRHQCHRRDFSSEMRVSEGFESFGRNLLAKTEFNGYITCYEIKIQFREECSSDVDFWLRNLHQHCCARRSRLPPG